MTVRPTRAPAAVTATVGNETVVYDPVKGALHVLDETASAVWSLLDGQRSLAEVVETLDRRYGPSAAIHGDVGHLLATLRDAGLLADEPPLAGFTALGYPFLIEADNAALGARARDMLRDLAAVGVADPTVYRLRTVGDAVAIDADGEQVVAPVTAERVAHMLLWHINQKVVRRATEQFVVLHAAAAERDGIAVILPAAMEHGKTTTVTGLVRAGYRYLSDELAVIDPATSRLLAYAKPLGIDPGAQHLFSELRPSLASADGPWQVPASAIRPDAVAAGAKPAVIIAPTYNAHAHTAAEPMSAAAMTVQLADCTFGFREHAHRDLRVLARLAEACACYRMTVSNLDDAIGLIDRAVAYVTRSRTDSTSEPGT